MKDIFTYPQNAPTYIDPDYVGDANSGFTKRIDDLRTGAYLEWTGADPASTTPEIMTGLGKYNNVPSFEEDSGNNTFSKFHQHPLVEFTMRAKAVPVTSQIKKYNTPADNPETPFHHYVYLEMTTDLPHNLTSGDRVYGHGFDHAPFNTQSWYAQVTSPTTFKLSEDQDGLVSAFDWLTNSRYNTYPVGSQLDARAIRKDINGLPGSQLKLNSDTSSQHWNGDTDVIYLNSVFTDPLDTGTLNQIDTPFYFNKLNNFNIELFTDAAKTIPATLNEHYVTVNATANPTTATQQFTSAGTYSIESVLLSAWGVTTLTQLQAEQNGWCRITATVTNGAIGAGSCPKVIGTTKSFSQNFWWQYLEGGRVSIWDNRDVESQVISDFVLTDTGGGVDIDVAVEFIDAARTVYGWNTTGPAIVEGPPATIRTDEFLKYEVDSANVILPGVERFIYQDTNNVTQNGAQYGAQYYPNEGTATDLPAGDQMPALSTIDLFTNNGSLEGFTYGPYLSDDRGIFTDGGTRLILLEPLPDTYVPPVVTPAEQQDVWDTDDEWETTEMDQRKEWPTVVTPMSASIVLNTPSTVNKSQNGIKYTRKSSFTKWTLEVNYPPMRAEQFREFHAVAQAANGQATPFYFVLRNADGNNILWPDFGQTNSTVEPLFKEAVVIADTTMLLEGFESFEADAFSRGEVVISAPNANGSLHTVVNTVDANVFGEAKIRVAMPYQQPKPKGSILYKDPYHAVVTLNSDDFSYTVDTAGFYNMSVTFDLDRFTNDT